jgi:hypothetical protein
LQIIRRLREALLDSGHRVQSSSPPISSKFVPAKFAKYAPVLRNSIACRETACERIFLMKDLAAVEEAVGLGAEIYAGASPF